MDLDRICESGAALEDPDYLTLLRTWNHRYCWKRYDPRTAILPAAMRSYTDAKYMEQW